VCDRHLAEVLEVLKPGWLIGVGDFALKRAQEAAAGTSVRVGKVLHPSPANPASNRGWAQAAERQLEQAGVW
jgi:single-strand selective monofunctional uracil DNA glycosylase